MPASDTIEAQGHLIDSGLLSAIFDKIIEHKAAYEILKFDIGRTNDDVSDLEMRITAADQGVLDDLLQQLTGFGCHPKRERNVLVKPAEQDRCVPDDFYSTTNHRTHVRLKGRWVEVDKQRMDAVIVVDGVTAACRKLRDVKAGERVVCGHVGIRVTPEFKERDRLGFAFMSNDVSSERRVEGSVSRIAQMMRDVKSSGGRIAVVAGPVVVHTGGVEHFSNLIRRGYVDVVLAGNALAVHDVEFALSGTSLGRDVVAHECETEPVALLELRRHADALMAADDRLAGPHVTQLAARRARLRDDDHRIHALLLDFHPAPADPHVG